GPNGYTSNQQNPVIPAATANLSGDYILFANNGACTSRDTVAVLVKPYPANFGATSNAPLCAGAAINFTATSSTAGVGYVWTGPNGFSSGTATPSIGGASAVHNGDYMVTATL